MESNIIKFGICVENTDPSDNHRIRVLMLEDEISTLNRNTNYNVIIAKRDEALISKYGANFQKWSIGNSFVDDPYVVQPLLPLNINIVPKVGELVKVIEYDLDVNKGYREYIGPATKDFKNLFYEDFKTTINNTENSNNLTKPESKKRQPNANNVYLSGRKNSFLEFLDDGILLSGGKYKRNSSELLNNNLAFKLLKRYGNEQKIIESEQTIIETPTTPINNIIEYKISENNGEIILILDIYNSEELVNNKNYSPTYQYLNNTNQKSISITVLSNNINNVIRFTQKLINNLNENRIGLNLSEQTTADGVTYIINDIRQPLNGVDVRGEQYLFMGLYLMRETPSTLNNDKSEIIQKFINSFTDELRPLERTPKPREFTVTVKEIEPTNDKGESYNIDYGSYNMILHDADRIKTFLGDNGFSQSDILINLMNLTEPTVRGYKLAEILIKIIEIIESHGHSTTGPNTISEGVKSELTGLKNDLLTILDKDQTNTNPLVNEKIRIS